MTNEIGPIYAWMKSVLTGYAGMATAFGGTPRFYRSLNIGGVDLPAIGVRSQSPGSDLVTADGERIWTTPLFHVYAIGVGAAGFSQALDPLVAISDQIEAAFYSVSYPTSASGLTIYSCIRESPWERSFIDDGRRYDEIGGAWRVTAG